MRYLPTDLQILNAIYDRYYDEFAAWTKENPNRRNKNYVPLDLQKIADDLHVDLDIVFGRLYYHLDKKHAYKEGNNRVPFFELQVEGDRHCIHFPFAASVLADLRNEYGRYRLSTTMSVISFFISVTSFLIAVLK